MLFAGQGQQGQAGQDVQESASRGPGMAGSSKTTLSKGLDVTGGSSRVSSSRRGLDPILKTSLSATKLPTITATVGR